MEGRVSEGGIESVLIRTIERMRKREADRQAADRPGWLTDRHSDRQTVRHSDRKAGMQVGR